jgi:heme a synthase
MTAADLTLNSAEGGMGVVKPKRTTHASVKTWLKWIAFLIFVMVLIGGATRLTDSGLSITEWQPIMGAIPPLSDADWQVLFNKYKETTEFKVQNSFMTLEQFKPIFWWEWGHRQFGRLIGVAFLLPFLYFLARGRLSNAMIVRLAVIFTLGAAQAALGWYMVQSGLTGRTDVSQYRLAAHLTLAALLFASIIWTIFSVDENRKLRITFDSVIATILVALILLQISFGGFVAGMDAGHASYTWPKMNGAWIPDGLWTLQPQWLNVFENALTSQFTHRVFAYVTLVLTILHAWRAFTLSAFVLAYAVFTQAAIGILTVMLKLPFSLALAHQGFAFIVLAFAVSNLNRQLVTRVPVPDQQ